MKLTVFEGDSTREAKSDDLPSLLSSKNSLFWVDMKGPVEEDLTALKEVFKFHPMAVHDTTNHRQRPKVEDFGDFLFIILNPVTLFIDHLDYRELDVFVGDHFIVTVHKDSEPVIGEAQGRAGKRTHDTALTPGFLLYTLIDTVLDAYFPVLEDIGGQLESLEDSIISEPRDDALRILFRLKRMLAEMWRIVWPQRDVLSALAHDRYRFIDTDALEHHMREASSHLLWIADMVNAQRDMLTGIIDIYMSATSNRLNRVINRLAVITVIVGVLTVISAFFGMNFTNVWPPYDGTWSFPTVVGLMIMVSGGAIWLFKKLGWI